MSKISVVIAAAGEGSRVSLPYPKTLLSIKGKPILVRIAELLAPYDNHPIVIVNRDGKKQIDQCLLKNNIQARLVVQSMPNGMGDAVLQSSRYRDIKNTQNSLLLWGDLPFIKPRTLNKLIDLHVQDKSDFSFPTLISSDPYTLVKRDKDQRVVNLIELKNSPSKIPSKGERDIGVFLYKTGLILDLLEGIKKKEDAIKEIGFLNLVRILFKRGSNINGYKIATKREALSFNSKNDLLNF